MSVSGWHLDKRVSVGHIVTTAAVAGSLYLWMSRIETAVEVNSVNIGHNAESISRVESQNHEQYAEIIRRLERIDDRLNQ